MRARTCNRKKKTNPFKTKQEAFVPALNSSLYFIKQKIKVASDVGLNDTTTIYLCVNHGLISDNNTIQCSPLCGAVKNHKKVFLEKLFQGINDSSTFTVNFVMRFPHGHNRALRSMLNPTEVAEGSPMFSCRIRL